MSTFLIRRCDCGDHKPGDGSNAWWVSISGRCSRTGRNWTHPAKTLPDALSFVRMLADLGVAK